MLRILCISPLFAPAANAEAFVSTKMVNALQQLGVSVTVVSSSNLYQGLKQDGSRIWDSFRRITVDVRQFEQPDRFRSALTGLQFQTPWHSRWVQTVLRKAQELNAQSRFDFVYSRSLPMAAHIAGYWCARKLKLPWVASINDPWDFQLYSGEGTTSISRFARETYLFWLKRTLSTADLVTYPSRGLHEFHARLAKMEHRGEVIPHIGYSAAPNTEFSKRQFRLVHAGMLGAQDKTGRSTDALLVGLKTFLDSTPQAAAETALLLVGPEDKQTQTRIMKLGLDKNVRSIGRVSYEESLTHIASASVCVLVESIMDEGIFLPSKLADYVACKKPVLALSPNRGTIADLAQRNELLLANQRDPASVTEAIGVLYNDFNRGNLASHSPSDRFVSEVQGQSVAAKFLSACKAFISDPRNYCLPELWQPNE